METAEGGPLTTFLAPFAFAYLAAALLPSGAMHLVRLRRFGTLLYAHGIIPPVLIVAVAVAVGVLEAGLGVAALLAAGGVRLPLPPAALPAGAIALGGVFVVYLLVLFNRPPRRPHSSCGCTPWESPLTGASLLPALGLVVIGLLGGLLVSGPPAGTPDARWILAALWGATLAPLMAMIPAVVPARPVPVRV